MQVSVTVTEAMDKLETLLSRVARGEEITILHHGKEVARIVPPRAEAKPLPGLEHFRASIRVSGEAVSSTVARMRSEGRY